MSVPYLVDYTPPPPFLHRSSAIKKGGGVYLKFALMPELRPSPRNAKSGFRVTVYTARLIRSLVVATK